MLRRRREGGFSVCCVCEFGGEVVELKEVRNRGNKEEEKGGEKVTVSACVCFLRNRI